LRFVQLTDYRIHGLDSLQTHSGGASFSKANSDCTETIAHFLADFSDRTGGRSAGHLKRTAQQLDSPIHVTCAPQINAHPSAFRMNVVPLRLAGAQQFVTHRFAKRYVYQLVPVRVADLASAQAVFGSSEAVWPGDNAGKCAQGGRNSFGSTANSHTPCS
jgi:hypothetical protein